MKHRKLLEQEYKEICKMLEIDPHSDLESTLLLDEKLEHFFSKKNLKELEREIKGKDIFIFGAGPSLVEDIEKSKQFLIDFSEEIVVVAVDGASKALLEKELKINLIVSDLDGGINSLLISSEKYNSFIIIHAHGDNKAKIVEFFSKIKTGKIIGSTQIADTQRVRNYGGFTDGDRAAYLVANMGAKNIFLFGFDFGNLIGKYSKPEEYTSNQPANERKMIKLQIAKKLLSKIPEIFPKIKIYNCSNSGEDIKNIQKINLEEIGGILRKK